MLDQADTDVIKRWLIAALESGKVRGLTKVGLAKHCSVSPQAVSGWLRTGRIAKSSLAYAAEYLGSSPSFNPSAPGTHSGLTSQEVDLLLAFRSLPKALQRARHDQLMADAEDAKKYAASVLAREGVNGRVSDARAAQFLPPPPSIDSPETVPGDLQPHRTK